MSAFGGPFSGMPAAAGAPGAPQQQQAAAFVLVIPPDPDWQPIETTDVLDRDGYYMARVKSEKPRTGDNETPGVWLTLELGDPDVIGKQLSKFLTDPRATKRDSWWSWRSLLRSIAGSTAGGQAGMTYTPGALAGRVCWIRTAAYIDKDGNTRTGVDGFVMQTEWEEAVKNNKHRWEAKPKSHGGGAAAVGALPGAGGGAFPGLGSGGLPGLPGPANPMAPQAPQPSAAAPMAQAPAAFPAAASPIAPPAAPAAPQQAFASFPPPPVVAPAAPPNPAQPFGAPQPGAASPFPAFPGT